jgi:geranylgeranyl reductase family protein
MIRTKQAEALRPIYDVAIIGAGPGGCSCAYMLRGQGLKVALIERSTFPRDKTCGDALSFDVINQLGWMSPELADRFKHLAEKLPSSGLLVVSPGGVEVTLRFGGNDVRVGYVCRREVFDNFMYEAVRDLGDIEIIQGCSVTDLEILTDGVTLTTDQGLIRAKAVVGADGAHSVVNKKTLRIPVERDHHSAGLRQYWENVKGFDQYNSIELIFLKEILPGYLWIFPMPNGRANVGIGMLSSEVSTRKVNLREVMDRMIKEHPMLRDRFADARPLETVKGHGLPLGSKKRKLSSDRVILIGDAASMIDPMSGEGVGNAMRCGRVAASTLIKALKENDLSAASLSRYDSELYQKTWKELRVSHTLQKLINYPRFFDFCLRRIKQSQGLQAYISHELVKIHHSGLSAMPKLLLRVLRGK